MKLPLHILAASLGSACAFAPTRTDGVRAAIAAPRPPPCAVASSRPFPHRRRRCRRCSRSSARRSSVRLRYARSGNGADTPDGLGGINGSNVWTILANTERWISDTLDRNNAAAAAANTKANTNANANADAATEESSKRPKSAAGGDEGESSASGHAPSSADNPYVRKEVSYACETAPSSLAVVGGIFRRVREAREAGEKHGKDERRLLKIRGKHVEDGEKKGPSTMRQTNVIVIPNCDELSDFRAFDDLVQAVNGARRKARDFVTVVGGEHHKGGGSDDIDGEGDGESEWSVSINCAHLHPKYGEKSPNEIVAEMKAEDFAGETDVNLIEYRNRRDEARRSPYPSVIVEVRATPPPDFGNDGSTEATPSPPPAAAASKPRPPVPHYADPVESADGADADVTSEDVRRLEALFVMSAATTKSSTEESFYDALGEAFGKKELAAAPPLTMARNWFADRDPNFNAQTSAFVESTTRRVDAAYEFVFDNLAASALPPPPGTDAGARTSYLVLPNFLPASATSFDKFAGQVSNILGALPTASGVADVATLHPEHVTKATRSPVPIVVLTWK